MTAFLVGCYSKFFINIAAFFLWRRKTRKVYFYEKAMLYLLEKQGVMRQDLEDTGNIVSQNKQLHAPY